MEKQKMKSISGGVLGIVGGGVMIAGMFILVSAVMTIAEALDSGNYVLDSDVASIYYRSIAAIFTYLAGGALGLVGGIIAVKKDSFLGGIFIFAAAAMSLVTGILAIAPLAFIMAGMFLIGGLLCLFLKKPIVDKTYYPPYQAGGYPPQDGYPPQGGYPPQASQPQRFDPQTGRPIYGAPSQPFDPYAPPARNEAGEPFPEAEEKTDPDGTKDDPGSENK